MTTPRSPFRRSLLAAVVATTLAAPALAQSPAGRLAGAPAATADAPQASQRFVVKLASDRALPAAAQGDAIEGTLDAALARAGLDRAVAGARGAASATRTSHLRASAAQGWHVVSTSRLLDARETAAFLAEAATDPAIERIEIDYLYQTQGIIWPPPDEDTQGIIWPPPEADVQGIIWPPPGEDTQGIIWPPPEADVQGIIWPPTGTTSDAVSPMAPPNDPNYLQYQWNFHNPVGGVDAESVWDLSTGEGVVVAILDTGIIEGTLDLAPNVIPGYDFITDMRVSRRDADGRVPGGWDVGSWAEENYCVQLGAQPHPPRNSSWHGTHVAGTVAQVTNNGIALAGLAHGAQVVPVRVLGSCGGFGSDISDAMIWAAGGEVEGIPANENPAEILNMSLGSSAPASCPGIYSDAIAQVNALGSTIVVAAGNANADAGTYTMSSCEGVISVGSTGITGAKAGYSNWGARVDLSAPGGGGAVDGNPNGYVWQVTSNALQQPTPNWILRGMSGTSMAAPHVAAVAALVQSVIATPLDWEGMRDLLVSTARPFPVQPPSATPLGAGIVDPVAAVLAALDTGEPPCDPDVEECEIEATPIANGEVVAGLSGAAGDESLYAIEVPAGARNLNIVSYGGSGDVSLYVSFQAEPTPGGHDLASTRPGNNETVRVSAPQAGTYYIKLVGEAPYARVNLQVRHN